MGRFFAVAFAFSLLAISVQATEELLPPFGFRWNDSMPRVETVLKGAKAKVVLREKKEGRDIWTVEGLVHPGLKRTRFTFKDRGLYGVELLYEYDRPIEWYNQRMGEIRKYFDEKYGTGKLVSRSRDTDTGRDPNAGRLPMDGRCDDARAFLFFRRARHRSCLSRDLSRLQSALITGAKERRLGRLVVV